MDPLLADGGKNGNSMGVVDNLGDEAWAIQDFEAVPHFVTLSSASTLISKVTGTCQENFVCDCSQFEDATEHSDERTLDIAGQQNQQIIRTKFHLWIAARCCSLWRFGFWKIMLGLCVIALAAVSTTSNHGRPTKQAISGRFAQLEECAKKMDLRLNCSTRSSEASSIRCRALEWFLGPGANVRLDCSWDTEFGMLLSLIILRESLGVQEPSWHSTVPLRGPFDVCEWTRVHCNDRGISGIYLNNVRLNGTIPSEILGLKNLRELWAYSSQDLVGSIPTHLGSLTNLENLELHQTSLTGTIPLELGWLSQLRRLFLHRTLVHGEMPTEVCKLRENGLELLEANCRGEHPMLSCSCCSSCKSMTVR